MSITYGLMQDEVRNHLKRDANAYTNERIGVRINWAQEMMGDLHGFRELKTSSNGSFAINVKTYSLPTNFCSPISLRLIDSTTKKSVKLIKRSRAYFDEFYPYPEGDSTNKPTDYCIDGLNFEVYPISDSSNYTYDLKYYKYAADLSTSSDVSEYLRKDRVIVAGATYLCALDLREKDMAIEWKDIFNGFLQLTISKELRLEADYVPVAEGFPSPCGMEVSNPEKDPRFLEWND